MLALETLIDLGYQTLEAADGASALKILQSDVRLDLLITDVGLPGGINGRQVADAGRALRGDLKIIFITGYAGKMVLDGGDIDRYMRVLTKPFTSGAFEQTISELRT